MKDAAVELTAATLVLAWNGLDGTTYAHPIWKSLIFWDTISSSYTLRISGITHAAFVERGFHAQ